MLRLTTAVLLSVFLAGGLRAAPAAVTAQLAPSGTLRAGINYNNPLLSHRDDKTGELTGVAVDLSQELARRLGIKVALLPFDAAGALAAAAKTGGWDVAYLAIDPARAGDIDFTAAYLELEGTYLVPENSPLKSIGDVDREGVKIAVTSKSAYDLYLTRELKHAQLIRFDTTPLSIDNMILQHLDAVAAVRTALVTGAQRVPHSSVLSGHFMTIPQAAGVPKGRPEAAAYLAQFIEEMKRSGFIAQALKRHGLGPDDALVAPPEKK
jgi:polar amino acid transport system substrate-binding protein